MAAAGTTLLDAVKRQGSGDVTAQRAGGARVNASEAAGARTVHWTAARCARGSDGERRDGATVAQRRAAGAPSPAAHPFGVTPRRPAPSHAHVAIVERLLAAAA